MRKKLYVLQPIRPGDIIQITYQETYQSENLITHRGYVVAFKRRNSLTAAIQMIVRMGGMNIKALYLIHSPKVKDIKLISKGSGNFRANMKYKWRKINKNDIQKPRIRNRVMKNRTGSRVKAKIRSIGSMEYDKIKSNNVKRLINM